MQVVTHQVAVQTLVAVEVVLVLLDKTIKQMGTQLSLVMVVTV
jgi:hypothetical protein